MNNYKIHIKKISKPYIENNNPTTIKKSLDNSNLMNSILRRKLNSHNAMKSLNSEISFKIKDNIALDILNNNASTLSSLLSKNNYNGVLTVGNISTPKVGQMKTIRPKGHTHCLTLPLEEINNSTNHVNSDFKKIYVGKINTKTIDINRNILFNNNNTYFSPCLRNNMDNNEKKGKEKKIDEVIINYKKYKKYSNTAYRTEYNEENKKNFNELPEKKNRLKNKSLKNLKLYENNESKNNNENNESKNNNENNNINNKTKIYKKKPIKSNNNIKNEKSKDREDIKDNTTSKSNTNTNTINEKKDYDNDKDKYIQLLNNYRKNIIKQFMHYFKPYYYRFIKKYFQIFILNIKKIKKNEKNENVIKPKKYIKKINKRNINGNGRGIKDLKLVQINYVNYNSTNPSNYDTDNSNNNINSYNNKNNQSKIDLLKHYKKINNFLINNNNINFKSIENLKDELYRNNLELEKKYTQIIKRKKRKKILTNDFLKTDYSCSQIKNDKKTIDISLYNKKSLNINNSYDRMRKNKIYYTPHSIDLKNSYNSNGEITKEESINSDKNKYNKIKSISKTKEQNKNIKEIILKNNINDKLVSPLFKRDMSGLKNSDKKYLLKNNIIRIRKKKNKIIMVNKKQKINNINNSHYNKNYISKKIKNIFTKDKKINIYINYVFFIPPKLKTKNIKLINQLLAISHNYSYTYIGKEDSFIKNKIKHKIYSKKKLSAIKEEEEKSKCSISILLQNNNTIEEYNSIITYLIKTINNYLIIKMKKAFLYKLKMINLFICIKNIIKNNIFKKIKPKYKDEKNSNHKVNDTNVIFLTDEKIIMNMNNMNNMNNVNYENDN